MLSLAFNILFIQILSQIRLLESHMKQLDCQQCLQACYCTNKSLNKFSIIQSWLISRAATRLLITSICKSQSLNSLTALLRQRLHSQWKDAILWITPTWIKYQIQQIHLNRHLPSTLSKEPCWCCFANEKTSQWFHPSPDRRLDRCWKRTQHR